MLTWYLRFVAVGWILALRKIGDTFDNDFFYIWNIVMTVLMCITWTVLIVLTLTAFVQGKIFISPREEVTKDSILHAKLRRHVADLELGLGHHHHHDRNGQPHCDHGEGVRFADSSRFTSQTVTPQPQSPRSRSRSPSRLGRAHCHEFTMAHGDREALDRSMAPLKKFSFGGQETPMSDSGMSTPRDVVSLC